MKQTVALMFFVCLPVAAQFHVGVKGGAALTDALDPSGDFESRFRRWTLGPMVELDLPLGLGVEFNALYRKTGYFGPTGRAEFSTPTDNDANSWEFPLLAKYKFPGVVRPYLAGGWAYRNISDVGFLGGNSNGLVFAGGIRINALMLKISPEIRYTRWNNEPATGGLNTNRNQFEILVGLTF
jgi:hypothetical protein